MSGDVRGIRPAGEAAWTITLTLSYVAVSVVLDPLVAPAGPFGMVVQPTAGLPVLFGVAFGPVGVAGIVAGVALESLFAGGGLAYSVAKLAGYGTVAVVAWVAWDSHATAGEPDGRSSALLSVVIVTLAAATVGNAGFGVLVAAVAGYPFAPVAVEGAVETTVATFGLAAVWALAARFGPSSVPPVFDEGAPSGDVLRRCLGVTAVGLAWITVATGVDTFVRDFPLVPHAVAEQRLPHAVNSLFENIAGVWWVEAILQFATAAVAVAAVASLLATGVDVSVDDPSSPDD